MQRFLPLICIMLLLGLAGCGDDDSSASPDPETTPCDPPAQPAPDLALADLAGGLVRLDDLRCDHVLLLDFWATWCGPCREGLPLLQELHDTYGDQGLRVLAVNLAEPAGLVTSFMEEHGYTFTALLDPERQSAAAYEITSIPRQVIIDAVGEIRFDRTGTNGIDDLDHHVIIPELLAELPR